jgi:hypothetical protein
VRSPEGTFVLFGVPSSPTSINNEGAITGRYYAQNGIPFGFVRSPDGTITSFVPPFCNVPNGVGPIPTSINDEGVVTGKCALPFPSDLLVGWVRFP